MPGADVELEVRSLSAEEISRRTETVRERLGPAAEYLSGADFERFTSADLERIFEDYDELFFAGALGREIGCRRASLEFALSRRMTRSGGRTWAHLGVAPQRFGIAVSSYLLGLSFADVEREIVVNGLRCRDRVDAFQRVFEHELVHLFEFLRWGTSSCGRRRYRQAASELFGHHEFGHRMVTQRERAREVYGLGVGDRVTFDLDGRRRLGRINRITKRATVLVSERRGTRYSDGRRYGKYYVPLDRLSRWVD